MDEQRHIKLTGEPEASGQVSIPQASRSLGLDTFTFYTLIQRDHAAPIRSNSGEIVVSEQDMNRLAGKE
jgi:hypothetical protein